MARIHTLTRNAPATYYVGNDDRTFTGFPPEFSPDELKSLKKTKARLLSRRERRAAFRVMRKPRPLLGGCFARHPY